MGTCRQKATAQYTGVDLSHPAVDLLVTMKPNRSVSGSKPTPDPASDPELSSSLGFFWVGLDGFNILLTEKRRLFIIPHVTVSLIES